jgi:hypothetical protein
MNKQEYETTIAPLIRAVMEKVRENHLPCLIAIEVDGVPHISGNMVEAPPRMYNAFNILFHDDDEPITRCERCNKEVPLTTVTTKQGQQPTQLCGECVGIVCRPGTNWIVKR